MQEMENQRQEAESVYWQQFGNLPLFYIKADLLAIISRAIQKGKTAYK